MLKEFFPGEIERLPGSGRRRTDRHLPLFPYEPGIRSHALHLAVQVQFQPGAGLPPAGII